MINCYCRTCGLYISVPDDFAGGQGSCPRCKSELRIPRPLPTDLPEYTPGIRYVAEPRKSRRARRDQPDVVSAKLGPSIRYHCTNCGERYESLRSPKWEQGQCPRCGKVNKQMLKSVVFPRPERSAEPYEDREALGGDDAVAAQAQKEADAVDARIDNEMQLDMRDGFLVAQKAETVADGAQIIDGRPYTGEEDTGDAPAVAGAMPADMEASEPDDIPRDDIETEDDSEEEPIWSYLMKGQKHGPVSTGKLLTLLAEGQINLSVLVYREGMSGWHPIEEIQELAEACDQAHEAQPAEESFDVPLPPAAGRAPRDLAEACMRMLWMFLAGASLTMLLAVTKDTFYNIGRDFLLGTGLVLATLLAVAAAYGGAMIYQNREAIKRLPSSTRTQAFAGTLGLVAAMAVAVALAVMPAAPPAQERPAQADPDIEQAQLIFNALSSGDRDAAQAVIDLDRLHFTGEEFDPLQRQLAELADPQRAVLILLLHFRRHCNPDQRPAKAVTGWKLEYRREDGAVVTADCPAKKDYRIRMRIHEGMLLELGLEAAVPETSATQPANAPPTVANDG